MSRRKKRPEEHPSHERWLVSYADFITLLFAFFVVMYSISSVNEGKYRVLSSTLTDAFQEPARSINPIQIGELQRSTGTLVGDAANQSPLDTDSSYGPALLDVPPDAEQGFAPDGQPGADPAREMAEEKRLGFIAGSIESVLEPFVAEGTVSVNQRGSRIEVEMKSQLLFESGSARLSRQALTLLRDVSRILRPLPNPLRVEGYTDNVPIHTAAFPSNWELSAARAASVVHLFARLGVNPARLAAVGYGEFRPVADNATEAGRRRNRRVSLVILAGRSGDRRPDGEMKRPERPAGGAGSPAVDGNAPAGGGVR